MGYSIEGQSPNEVENIKQRVNLQRRVGELDKDMKRTSMMNPRLISIYNTLQQNLREQASTQQVFDMHKETQGYINYKFNELDNQLNMFLSLFNDNIVDQTDLDEVYKYVKNTRTNVNKKLNALKKQIEEQDEKIDKIIMLLEEKDKE